MEGFNLNTDFVKPALISTSSCKGVVVGVSYDPEKNIIKWNVVLQDNIGIYKDDHKTPVDSSKLSYDNLLPNPEDGGEISANGLSKRQNKINMLKRFADKMRIDMSTPDIIMAAIEGGKWLGIPVICDIIQEEWNGETFNKIKRMYSIG